MAFKVDIKIILMVAWAAALYKGNISVSAQDIGQNTTETILMKQDETTQLTSPSPAQELTTEGNTMASTMEETRTTTGATVTEEQMTTARAPATTTKKALPKRVWLLVKDGPWTGFEYDKFGHDFHPDIGGNVRIVMLSLYEIQNDPKNMVIALCKEIDEAEPEIVLDFTMTALASEAVKVTTRGLKIPTVAVSPGFPGDIREWRNLSPEEEEYLIQILPPSAATLRITRVLSMELKLHNLVIFYGEGYKDIVTLPSIQKSLLRDTITRHIFVRMKSRTEKEVSNKIHRQLTNWYNTFLVIGSSEEISNFMEMASKEGAVNDEHPFFNNKTFWFTLSEKHDFEKIKWITDAIHIFPQKDDSENLKSSELAGSVAMATLDEIARYEVFLTVAQAYLRLKMSDPEAWNQGPRLTCGTYKLGNYTQFRLKLKTEMASVLRTENSGISTPGNRRIPKLILGENGISRYNLTYKIATGKTNSSTFDRITRVSSVRIDEDGDYRVDPFVGYEFKMNVVYRIVTVVQPPFVYKRENCKPKHKYEHCYYGYVLDILDELQKALKFNYTIMDVQHYGFMADRVPFKWDGMVRMLQDQEVDLAIGAISVYPERDQVIDFTANIYGLVGFQVLMRREKLKTSLFKFMTVLENDVWMCILGAFFLTSFLLWIFDRWSPYSYQNNREKYVDDDEKREFFLKESLWFCMTSLTPQGGGEAPKNLSGRLVAATWWLFGFIIIASYTANLAAFLTVSRLEVPIESLEDLARQYKVQYAPIKHSSAWHHFDRMAHVEHAFYEVWKDMSLNDSLTEYERSLLAVWEYPVSDKYTKIWQAVLENAPPANASEAVVRVRSQDPTYYNDPNIPDVQFDEFAWISESTEIKYHYMTNCRFRIVGHEFAMAPYAFMVQKGSPLKEILSKEIRRLETQRYFEVFDRKWWDDNPEQLVCAKDDDLADGISISNIGGVFVIIMTGLTSTVLALIMECWWYVRTLEVDEMSVMEHDDRSLSREFSATYSNLEKTDFTSPFALSSQNPLN